MITLIFGTTEDFKNKTQSTYETAFTKNMTVVTLLFKMTETRKVEFKVMGFEGVMQVVTINGKRDWPEAGKYWISHINDKALAVGVDKAKLKRKDVVKFVFATYQLKGHNPTILKLKNDYHQANGNQIVLGGYKPKK